MVPRPRELRECFNSEPVTDLAATEDPIMGRVMLLTRDGSRGQAFPMPCTANELPDWLVDNGLGEAPLVLVYRKTLKMSIRLRGADGDLSRTDQIRDTPPSATLQELFDALNHIHLYSLLTPGICIEGVWQPNLASYYVPGPEPEKSIQTSVAIGLNSWFHGILRAEVEDSTSIGRIDVRLLMPQPNCPNSEALAYWAIVELKVVKSFSNSSSRTGATTINRSKNVDAVIKGVRQVYAYQANRGTSLGLLEVYDLRRDKSDDLFQDNKVRQELARLIPPPTYTVRPLFGSPEDARQAGYTGL